MKWTLKDVERYYLKNNAKSEERTVFAKFKFDFSKSKPFEDFSKSKQKIIINQMKSENRIDDIIDYTFYFTKISPIFLPRSYWENILIQQSYPKDIIFKDDEIKGFKVPIMKIRRLEKNILENGYDKNNPLLIRQFNHSDPKIGIDAGHHRLQSIRNLIKKNKISRSFYIPIIVMFRKSDFGYSKINFKGITDYSFYLDMIIKNDKTFSTIFDTSIVNIWFNGKKSFWMYVKRRNDVIYIEFSFIVKKFRIPYVIEFMKMKLKNTGLKLKVKSNRNEEVNNIVKKMNIEVY